MIRNDRRWYPCACNCDNCRDSGVRVRQQAGIIRGRNIVIEGVATIVRCVPVNPRVREVK